MWAPGFETLLQKGIDQHWYDDVNVADRYVALFIYESASKLTKGRNRIVFRWLAIPWLQKAADSYVYDHNTSRRRANRSKALPNEVPDVMYENPEIVNALDFRVTQDIG